MESSYLRYTFLKSSYVEGSLPAPKIRVRSKNIAFFTANQSPSFAAVYDHGGFILEDLSLLDWLSHIPCTSVQLFVEGYKEESLTYANENYWSY